MSVKQYEIKHVSGDPATDIALDTIRMSKQALVFVNSKRSAESTAEKIGRKNGKDPVLENLAHSIKSVLSKPTKQCERLAYCVERQVAFHHAGLAPKQRELVEKAFIEGQLKILSATPTLAAGVNVPAFRTIIRDVSRYSGGGMVPIAVLEYHQMAGRSGRPDFNDEYGEAIVIAKHDGHAQTLAQQYLFGEPEPIYSKVASMPVLRTHCLALIAQETCTTVADLQEFFAETFFAHQYGDAQGIQQKITETLNYLRDWEFLQSPTGEDPFQDAHELHTSALKATRLGKRVSELYLDPLTAHELITGLKRSGKEAAHTFAYAQLICSALEMRPTLRVKIADYEELQEVLKHEELLTLEPSIYEHEYEDFLSTVKTARMLNFWMEEAAEEFLLETFNVRPGELKVKLDLADWLCYSTAELARIMKAHHHISPLTKLRTRLKYGAKEELLALLRFTGIGRVRARTLFKNNIADAGDVKEVDVGTLAQLIGPKNAEQLKKQVGQDVQAPKISTKARTGQLRLDATRFSK